jgi:hypothetical protein
MGLRKSHPHQARPFKLPFPIVSSFIAFYACNLLVYWTGWHTVYRMMIAMMIGFAFFIVHCCRQKNNTWIKQWSTSWWIAPYIIGMCVISYFGTFGQGIGKITFGADFYVIAIFTALIFFLAVKLGRAHTERDVLL